MDACIVGFVYVSKWDLRYIKGAIDKDKGSICFFLFTEIKFVFSIQRFFFFYDLLLNFLNF